LRYAAVAAQELHASLSVVTVEHPLLAAALQRSGVHDSTASEREALRAFCSESLEPEIAPDLEVRIGKPETEILAVAAALPADLLVIGSHGLTGLQKHFFGSTAECVLRQSDVPVLVIPTDVHAPATGADVRALLRRILVPVDLGEDSRALTQVGAILGAHFNCPVLLLHALPPIESSPRVRGHAASLQRELRDDAEVRLRQLADHAARAIEPIVLFGDPAETIADVAEVRGTGLIVMGLNHSGERRVGAVAYRVLSRTHAPVLALPAAITARLTAPLTVAGVAGAR
jgi:nucleotide-binding universal stress UspA family protein